MKHSVGSFRVILQGMAIVAMGAVGLHASPVCNSTSSGVTGTVALTNTVTCNIFVDIFNQSSIAYLAGVYSGGISGLPLPAASAKLESSGSSNTVTIPGWDEATSNPTIAMALQSVTFNFFSAAKGTVTVGNPYNTSQSFTAYASVPMTISGAASIPPVTVNSGTVSGSVVAFGHPLTTDNLKTTLLAANPTDVYTDLGGFDVNCTGLSDYGCQLLVQRYKYYDDNSPDCLDTSVNDPCPTYYNGPGSDSGTDTSASGTLPNSYLSAAYTATGGDCTAVSGTFSHTGSTLNPTTLTCSNVSTGQNGSGTFSSTGVATATYGSTTAPYPGAYEGGNSNPSLSFTASAGTTSVTGSGAQNLTYSGQGSIGGILEITFVAEAVPIPEPFTLFLVGGALVGAGLLRRRTTRRP
jgi:hypothetical protein